jgi:hypothetical protein
MSIAIEIIGPNGPVSEDEAYVHLRSRRGPTPFVINEQGRKLMADLRQRAEANPISFEAMTHLVAEIEAGRQVGAPAYCVAQTISLVFGWTVTYTVEEHKEGVPCRHLSIGSPNPARVPVPAAVEMIMPEFGFVGDLQNTFSWPEHLLKGGVAINVLQPMSGKLSDIAADPIQ